VCTPYFIDGEEILRADGTCWCPLGENSPVGREAALEFTALVLAALARTSPDNQKAEIRLSLDRW